MKAKNIRVPLRDGVMGAHVAYPDRALALTVDFFRKHLS